MNDHVRSLLRFWWVLVIGLAVAQVAAIMAVYKVDLSTLPPELTERQQPSYSAQGRLLVTDNDAPHLRSKLTTEQVVPPTGDGGTRGTIPVTQPPDTATLIQAANVYPSLIDSDPVAALREELFGPTPGTLRTQALYAVSTASRFTPSRVPVIQMIGVADTPQQAIQLVDRTGQAFVAWMKREQDKRKIAETQRIAVTPLQTPKSATEFGGPSSTLPVLVFGVVLMAFVALALSLDRLFPRRQVETVSESAHEAARSSA